MQAVKDFFKKVFTKENMKRFFFSFIWLGVLIFVLDIVSKWIVVGTLKDKPDVVVIQDFLELSFITNDGAAFSLGSGMRVLWIIISILLSAGLIAFYVKKFNTLTTWSRVAFMLMIAGAVGNLIDRCFYWESTVGFSGVVDWIWMALPIVYSTRFNIADASLVIGVFILIVLLIIDVINEALKKSEKEAAQLKPQNDQQKSDKTEKLPANPGQNSESKEPEKSE